MATTFSTDRGVFSPNADVSDREAPVVRKIDLADLGLALDKGMDDFRAMPSHAIVLCAVYPLLGLLLARLVLGYSVMPLLFPVAAGFALLGPFAALGLYEMSRRRSLGEEVSASDAFAVLRMPSFGAMLGLGALLLTLFATWIAAAQAIYVAAFGYAPAASIPDFVARILTTPEGWMLILVGCGVGFLFALFTLCISVVSFPMMLDRHANMTDAISTSLRVAVANPVVIGCWGLIVAILLAAGSLPFFLGLPVVLPLLGHATWHLYRLAVEPSSEPRPEPTKSARRSAADFPASLFAPYSRETDRP